MYYDQIADGGTSRQTIRLQPFSKGLPTLGQAKACDAPTLAYRDGTSDLEPHNDPSIQIWIYDSQWL